MKKVILLVLALALVFSVSIGVSALDVSEAKNYLSVTGKVDFADNTKIAVSIEDEDGNCLYFSEFDCVKSSGDYTATLKYTGDITKRIIKAKYNDTDVTSGIVSATSVTDMAKADVKAEGGVATITTEDKLFYEDGCKALVMSYDEAGKLIDVKEAENVTLADKEATVKVPENAAQVKAVCYNAMADVLKYGKAFEGLMPKVDVFCIGDSYGQTWTERWYPESGWGAHIGDYFNDRTTVRNMCTSGGWAQAIMSNTQDAKYQKNIADGVEGTKSMWGWDDWADMEKSKAYSKGDYVIVSLGLNDASKYGPDNMEPVDWYALALEEMAKRTQEKGVNLILCSPLQRATIKMDPTTKMFAAKTEEIAKKYNVLYINALEALQKQYASECKSDDEVLRKYYLHREELLKPVEQGGWGLTEEDLVNHGLEAMRPEGSGKNAHPNVRGADNMARTMIELIKEAGCPLAEYLK